jgi:hypothetical protein
MKTRLFLVLLGLLVVCPFSLTQGLGSIVGTVIDPSGAVVPAAKVSVIEPATGYSRLALTNSDGYYVLASLRPTGYVLIAEARGFRAFKQTGITLLADQTLTVNVSLQLGATTELVTVTGNEVQVDTSTATLKQVIEMSRLQGLPLNGRNVASLTLLVPGALPSASGGSDQGTSKTIPGAVTFSVNGSRQNQTTYLLDGGNNLDEYTNVNQPFPFPDALQEFSVQTSNYSAEYGQNAGAVVNIITRSGANSVHGDLFEYVRNPVFNAQNFFSVPGQRDKVKRNQFGGTIGGPVVLPFYNGRNRTFFFVGYQGTRRRDLGDAHTQTVPTPTDIAAVGASINPASKNVLQFLPQPTDANGTVRWVRPDRQNFDEVIGRVDHSFAKNDRLTLRLYYDRFQKDPVFSPTNILTYQDGSTIPSQNYLIKESHVFTPRLVNDARFSFSREAASRGPASNVPSVRDFGVNIPFQPSAKAIQSISVSGAFNFGDNPNARFVRNNFSWGDDVSWSVGRHDLRFGGVLERSRVDIDNLFFQPATFTFSSSSNPSRSAIQNFLRGNLNSFRQGFGEFKNNRNLFTGVYLQDNFHMTRRLNLTFGLRYEPFLPWREIKGRVEQFRIADFQAGRRSTVFVNAPPGLFFPGDAGVPENGTRTSLNNFAPRIGFAYDVFGDGRTSIRGGAGIFYDTRQVGIVNNRFVDVSPFSPQLTLSSGPLLGPFNDPLRSGATPSPFPVPFPPPSSAAFPPPVLAVTYDPNTKFLVPTVYNWNLTVERQVRQGWLVRVGYVGSHASHIKETVELNPAPAGSGTKSLALRRMFAGFDSISMDEQDVNSFYHALQLGVERRVASGLTILGSYTYSKTIDTLPVGGGVVDIGADSPSTLPWFYPNRKAFDRGLSDFDRTHRFVVSYVWQLPRLAGSSGLLRALLGNWLLSGDLTAQTGRPFTVTSGFSGGGSSDSSQTGLGQDRAFISGPPFGAVACSGVSTPCINLLNASPKCVASSTCSFTQPAVGTFGNVSKNSLRWPGAFNWDLGVVKDIPMGERVRTQFRAEFFNVLNHVNPDSGQTAIDNATRVNSGTFGSIRAAEDPRIIQLALKLFF